MKPTVRWVFCFLACSSASKEECRSFNSEVIKRLIDSLKREGVAI
ncbi:Arc family DNA-binding protein [Escherichia coli]|nr:Arc family DNA-binding protein [Escherichia coli]